MDNYTIYCTEEQTRKALGLGAPISKGPMIDIIRNEIGKHCFLQGSDAYWFPTAEQMLGWLEKQGLDFYITTRGCSVVSYLDYGSIFEEHDVDRKTSTLKAIDAALDYLADNNLIK